MQTGLMDYADFFLGAGRRMTCPVKRWRRALTVILTCRVLARRSLLTGAAAIVRRSPSYVSIKIHNADDGTSQPGEFSVGRGDETFRRLVRERRAGDLARLGGGGGLAAALLSGAENGIPGDRGDVGRRQEAFGRNAYPKPKPKGFFRHVVDALSDVFLLVLLGCAAVSLAFGIKEHGIREGWYDGVSIFLAVFLVAAVSAVSNHGQTRRFDKLASESEDIAVVVMRGGRRQEVSIFDVVVGDVVLLKIGDQVPADGVFLEGHSLQVDESSMTGEPDPVDVDAEKSPFLSSGVKVVDGYGRMLVTAVGTDTEWGEMMSSITRESAEPTPLQERLEGLTSGIGKIGIAVAVLVFAVLTARHFTGSTRDEQGRPEFDRHHTTANAVISALVGIFQQAVTIIVVAIPEGLPLAVTLTLAFSMKRMMKDHALVRRLSACETMGSVTAVCTDKTGTLTLNQMKVTDFWVGTEHVGTAASPLADTVVGLLCQGAGLNTTGSVFRSDNVSPPEVCGSPTEKALLSWAVAQLGMDADALRRRWKVVHVEAFNSDKKRSGVLIRENSGGAVTAHWKGAAEMILARCSTYVGTDGLTQELGPEERLRLESIIRDMAAASLRCIAFACKHVDAAVGGEHREIDDEGLTLLGFVGLKDPCRPEVKSAIEACTKAGVAVKMVTGDNVFTARAIASECGIVTGDDTDGILIEGHEFRSYTPEQQLEAVDRIRVMARSSPLDKLLMVQRLKQRGHVVAVTGDGTNDAPALKEADVGLSMGVQGTEVAKESSDVVILDDNFDTVVAVMRWGRCVYDNIQKFIQFQLTVNVAALVINFVSATAAGKVPLTTVQLLWVNLIMDTMGALALATDKPTKELMSRKPIGRTEPLISNAMWRNIAAQAAFQVAVLLAFEFRGDGAFGEAKNTMVFNTFVLCQVFNEFNCRKLQERNVFAGVLGNRLFVGIVAATVVLQVAMVELLRRFAGTERLGWGQWGVCIAVAALSWPIGWAVKYVPVPDEPLHRLLSRALKCFRK